MWTSTNMEVHLGMVRVLTGSQEADVLDVSEVILWWYYRLKFRQSRRSPYRI